MEEKETLAEVLNYLKTSELPMPIKKNKIFVRAIVKVLKTNSHQSYAYAVNDGYGRPLVKKVFGSISMIKEIVEIYPLTYLEDSVLPDFRKKTDIVEFLKRHGVDDKKASDLVMSEDKNQRQEAKELVVACCVKSQIERENMRNKSQSNNIVDNKNTNNTEHETTGENDSDNGETGTEETGVAE